MFKKNTVIILGAGASAEFNMPVGSRLMAQVADAVQFDQSGYSAEFRGRIMESVGAERAEELVKLGPELSSLIGQFKSMDEVLYFLSDKPDVIELGKMAIAHQIIKAEQNSLMHSILLGEAKATKKGDKTWANEFLKIAISATRRPDSKNIFKAVTIIDFNYDRILPQYLHSALQRLYGFTELEAIECLSELMILHPYGSLGPLPWQNGNDRLPFGPPFQDINLKSIAGAVRTYTEEYSGTEIKKIKKATKDAQVVIVLGFGFHPQNMEILTPEVSINSPRIFLTVYGIGDHNHGAVTEKFMDSIRSGGGAKPLPMTAVNFMRALGESISLAVS